MQEFQEKIIQRLDLQEKTLESIQESIKDYNAALLGDPLKGQIGALEKIQQNQKNILEQQSKIDDLAEKVENGKNPLGKFFLISGSSGGLGAIIAKKWHIMAEEFLKIFN